MWDMIANGVALGLAIGAVAVCFVLMWASGMMSEFEAWKKKERADIDSEVRRRVSATENKLNNEIKSIHKLYEATIDIRFFRDIGDRSDRVYGLKVFFDPAFMESISRFGWDDYELPRLASYIQRQVARKLGK